MLLEIAVQSEQQKSFFSLSLSFFKKDSLYDPNNRLSDLVMMRWMIYGGLHTPHKIKESEKY